MYNVEVNVENVIQIKNGVTLSFDASAQNTIYYV